MAKELRRRGLNREARELKGIDERCCGNEHRCYEPQRRCEETRRTVALWKGEACKREEWRRNGEAPICNGVEVRREATAK